MKVEAARLSAKDKIERLAQQATDNVSFWRESTEVLRSVVPFDFHPCWFTVDPSNLLVTGHMNPGLDYTPPEIARAWYAEGDVNSPEKLVTLRGGAITVAKATGGDPLASWRWRNLLDPMGFDDSLDAVFRTRGTVWGAISLLHTSSSRPFTSEDVRFVSSLSGAFASGTQLGLLRGEASDGGRDSPAVLIVSRDLISRTATANADAWLADLPDIGRYRPDRLPLPVQVIVLRALDAPDGEASAIVRSTSRRWVRIHGSLVSGRDHQVAIVIERPTPRDMAPLRLSAYGLTPRERDVVELVLGGHSTQTISHELFISEYTVQDRLKSIFEKVGVRSRRELVAAVHGSEYAPVVEANDDRQRNGLHMIRSFETSS